MGGIVCLSYLFGHFVVFSSSSGEGNQCLGLGHHGGWFIMAWMDGLNCYGYHILGRGLFFSRVVSCLFFCPPMLHRVISRVPLVAASAV
ncbi:hypothetical protein V8C34DRAFT_142583 [Trichoderma compactum]